MTILDEFCEAVHQLRSLRCLGTIAGPGTGSVISVHFGQPIPLSRPSRNENLPPLFRTHEGEFILFVDCVWRLDSPEIVVCGAWDDNSPGGPMLTGLSKMQGATIEAIEGPVRPALDLGLVLDNSHTLRIFCDQVNTVDATDNYSLFTRSGSFTVGPRSVLRSEAR